MTLPFALVVGATRFATLTTTHGIAHAIADAVLPTLSRFFRHRRNPMHDLVSIAFALLCTLGSLACHRKAVALVTARAEAGDVPRAVDALDALPTQIRHQSSAFGLMVNSQQDVATLNESK